MKVAQIFEVGWLNSRWPLSVSNGHDQRCGKWSALWPQADLEGQNARLTGKRACSHAGLYRRC